MIGNNTLTNRQRELKDFIACFIQTNGYAPSIREMQSAMDIKSPNGIVCHLDALIRKGEIRKASNRARSYVLVDGEPVVNRLRATVASLLAAVESGDLQPITVVGVECAQAARTVLGNGKL